MPAIGLEIGTPPSISARVEAQAEAIDEEPFDDKTSETTLMAYGNPSFLGITGSRAFSAKAPWPISRRPGAPTLPVSPTEYGGKLYWCTKCFFSLTTMPSIIFSSDGAPKVNTDKTWVSPRWNKPLPCVRGKRLISVETRR